MLQPASESATALPPAPWSIEKAQVLEALGVRSQIGLSAQEVEQRRERFGPNVLEEFHETSWLTILLRQLRSFVVYLLLVGAGLSFALGDHVEGIAILAVIVINTLIGFVTELRAVRSTEALRQLGSTETTVRRGGVAQRVRGVHHLRGGELGHLEQGEGTRVDAME